MSRYHIDKLLRDMRRDPAVAASFRDDIESVLDRYQLDAEERDLLRRWEIRKLYDRGASPLLLMLAHPLTGRKMRDYTTMMNPQKSGVL
ncbi:MAG TPA: hypothetical protein VMT64_02385 [Candidatus Binataceae bacterium]|nr:hypothetical protein [Candidatus Binataceae bacterium]